jgi:hypothetical protein
MPTLYLLGYLIYLFNRQHSTEEAIMITLLLSLYTIFIAFIFFKLLRNSLVRLAKRIKLLKPIPGNVLTGYLFIFSLFFPVPVIIIAILAKLFIWGKKKEKTYIDKYGNEVTQIKSQKTPTIILSRKEEKTGEEEHIVMTKLKKKPKKIIYE